MAHAGTRSWLLFVLDYHARSYAEQCEAIVDDAARRLCAKLRPYARC